MMRRFYRLDLYKIDCVFADSGKQLEKEIQKDFPDYASKYQSQGRCVSWYAGNKFYVGIYADRPSTLAHECVHAANEIFQHIGQNFDKENDEAFCYLVEHLFKQYCEMMKPEWTLK